MNDMLHGRPGQTHLPRVFQIGFNRCGTTSLEFFFRDNGYRALHRRAGKFSRAGTLAVGMELARREGRPLLTYAARVDLYSDMEKINLGRDMVKLLAPRLFRRLRKHIQAGEPPRPIYAFKYFAALDAQYPRSRFILNTRDPDRWVASRLRFNEGKYRSCHHGDRVHASEAELGDCWLAERRAHHESVRAHFRQRPADLLVFDIEQDGPDKLVAFLPDFNLNPAHWRQHNAST